MARQARSAGRNAADEIADELYGLPLDEFTATRNERARTLKQDGDTDASDAVGRLKKPTVTGWLANQLVRRHRDEIEPLLELGASLRAATADLDADQLRALSTQQRRVVHALVQQARALGADSDQPVSDGTVRELEDTLHATLADEQAAQQLIQGRLTSGLSRSGFPGLDLAAAPAARSTAKRSSTGKGSAKRSTKARSAKSSAKSRAADREREREAQEAQDAAEEKTTQAREVQQRAHADLDAAEQAMNDAASEVDRLVAELDDAKAAHSEAERARRQARTAVQRADRDVQRAERALAAAADRRENL